MAVWVDGVRGPQIDVERRRVVLVITIEACGTTTRCETAYIYEVALALAPTSPRRCMLFTPGHSPAWLSQQCVARHLLANLLLACSIKICQICPK